MEKPMFKNIEEVEKYLQDHGFSAKNRSSLITKRSIYNHIENGFIVCKSNGSFAKCDVDKYADSYLQKNGKITNHISLKDQLLKEQIRLKRIEADKKMGELVSLSEEIKRRAAVLEFLEQALLSGKLSFIRQLDQNMKQRHSDSDTLNDFFTNAGEIYQGLVEDMFDGSVKRAGNE
jgi:hypothetical protein